MSDEELVFGDDAPRQCPKCAAASGLTPRFHTGTVQCLVERCTRTGGAEHLHWTCDVCRYERTTPCADALAQI